MPLDIHNSIIWVPTRVSNGKRFSCPTGQRDKRPLIVPGQRRQRDKEFHLSRDKGTSEQAQNLATGWDGPGFFEAVQFRPGASCGTKLPSILPNNAVFRTKNKKNFIFFICLQNRANLSHGTSWYRGSCPRIFAAALVPSWIVPGHQRTGELKFSGEALWGNSKKMV